MSEVKRLRLADLNDEQFACLRDHNRRAEAHRMLDDLEARCGYDVERIRATLPPLGTFREIVESYTFMTEVGTGGNCTAVRIPCDDGTYLLITDLSDPVVPADDAEVVLVGRYTDSDNEPVDITRDLPASGIGPREVRTGDLRHVIDTALGLRAEPSRPAARGAAAATQRVPGRSEMQVARGPYRIEPDQASQGCQLAIVSADGEVLARTPECPEFGAPEQAQDWRNGAQLAAAWTLREALEEIETFDRQLDEGQVVPTANHYNEVVTIAIGALTRMRALEAEVLARHREAAGSRQALPSVTDPSNEQDEEQDTEAEDSQDLGPGR
ncbi:MAG: hypothetical protein ACYCT1_02070 [Steroidobacteraceae bacterium]